MKHIGASVFAIAVEKTASIPTRPLAGDAKILYDPILVSSDLRITIRGGHRRSTRRGGTGPIDAHEAQKSWSYDIQHRGIVNLAARGMLVVSVARRLGSEGPLLARCAARSNRAGPQKGAPGPLS